MKRSLKKRARSQFKDLGAVASAWELAELKRFETRQEFLDMVKRLGPAPVSMMASAVPPGSLSVSAPIRTSNPNNGQTGNSRLAGIMKSRARRLQRAAAHNALLLNERRIRPWQIGESWHVTVTRVAPSNGLDPHDGLRAAMKGCVDGIADWLGLKNDRDKRVAWDYDQRRGKPGEYAVEIVVAPRQP